MDKKLDEAELYLDAYRDNKDMTAFYATFSKAIEKAWLAYLGEGKEFNGEAQGRGKVTPDKDHPETSKLAEKDQLSTIRIENRYKAVANQKQARRFEEIAFRISLIENAPSESDKVAKYNAEALKNIKKNLDKDEVWQRRRALVYEGTYTGLHWEQRALESLRAIVFFWGGIKVAYKWPF